jgi:hypothetical protein
MGLIRVLDFVERCYNSEDGQVIHDIIVEKLAHEKELTVSMEGVDWVPSSFVNAAFISLLDMLAFNDIKQRLRFVNTTSQINEMIRTRFNFETNRRASA